jgi:ABC-type uncharacterized transport system substrate-binding protein
MPRTLALLAALLPFPAAAHPHVFIDAGLTLILDDENRLTAIRVTWAYDELYSLLVLEELGLDPDYDGILTDEELATLNGFDMNWMEGFEGDTYASAEDGFLALGPPLDHETSMEDARIVTRHTRTVLNPPVARAVSVKAYDPTFYTAYEVSRGVAVEGGAACDASVLPADLDAAYTMLEELLYGPRSVEWDEDSFPEVGESFADEIRLTCASAS